MSPEPPPNSNSGRDIPAQVSLVDVAPTVLDSLGIAPPTPFDGIPLWTNLTAVEPLPQRTLFAEGLLYGPPQSAIVRWPNKIIVDHPDRDVLERLRSLGYLRVNPDAAPLPRDRRPRDGGGHARLRPQQPRTGCVSTAVMQAVVANAASQRFRRIPPSRRRSAPETGPRFRSPRIGRSCRPPSPPPEATDVNWGFRSITHSSCCAKPRAGDDSPALGYRRQFSERIDDTLGPYFGRFHTLD